MGEVIFACFIVHTMLGINIFLIHISEVELETMYFYSKYK
jgi:hypothetical protein